ncbi:hypothetical protein WJX84_007156 [Apatococcus fuscideae]|uniref:Uncharacterized protein n=1 Tax=Apatococcus fuscideae TaxID=2026836 RepID=A0AAW1T9C0_9CHLO
MGVVLDVKAEEEARKHSLFRIRQGIKELCLESRGLEDYSSLAGMTNLQILWLAKNCLRSLEGLTWATQLRMLFVQSNCLVCLEPSLRQLSNLQVLDVSCNLLQSLDDSLLTLRKLPNLVDLVIEGNPCYRKVGDVQQRLHVIRQLPRLTVLNRLAITAPAEKDGQRRSASQGIAPAALKPDATIAPQSARALSSLEGSAWKLPPPAGWSPAVRSIAFARMSHAAQSGQVQNAHQRKDAYICKDIWKYCGPAAKSEERSGSGIDTSLSLEEQGFLKLRSQSLVEPLYEELQSSSQADDAAHMVAQGERLDRWDAALGNAADAQVALDVIERAIDDAVYLGEDAFNQLLPTQAYTRTIQAQHRRIMDLERTSMDTLQRLRASDQGRQRAEARAAELQQELENNAEVFKLHYTELLTKDEEPKLCHPASSGPLVLAETSSQSGSSGGWVHLDSQMY